MDRDMMELAFQEDEPGSCVQDRLLKGKTGERPDWEIVIEFRCELIKTFNRIAVGTELMI